MTSDFHRRDWLRTAAAGVVASAWTGNGLSAQPAPLGPITSVRRHLGRPQFFLDGRPYAKPVFETYVPQTKYFRQFAAAGTEVFSFSTNLGAGFSAPVWLGPNQWDFKTLDELARRVLEANPRGWLLPRIYLTAPDWWVRANPEECQVLGDGAAVYRAGAGHGRDARAFPSLASAKWRQDTAAALQQVIAHLQQADYGGHLFGYMLTGLMSEEWYHWSIHTSQLSDYSRHARQAFRQWLQAKYHTPEALRRAWHDPRAEFATVQIPSSADRQFGRERTFRDPAREMPVIDWYLFYNDLVPDTLEQFCRAAKDACARRKVVGAFYCYMFEFGGDPEFGHNALAKLLRSPDLDFVMVTASYFDRQLGRGADYARGPLASLRLHDKLWYHDNDTVSFRYDELNKSQPDRATVARYRIELGVTDTPQETIWQYRRSAGFVLGNGVYQSFFDLHGGYFDDPQLLAEIGRLNRVLEDSAALDGSSVAEILVLADEASCAYATFQSGFLEQSLRPAQVQLAKLGAPHDSILVDDLALLDPARYKLVVVLNCFHLTDRQRALLRRQVLNRGRTVLWCYAPGWFQGGERSTEAMQALTGIRIMPAESQDRWRLRIDLKTGRHKVVDDAFPSGAATIGWPHVWAQLLHVADDSATVLGTLEGRSEVVLALKQLSDWTSVYTANPVLPAALLRSLARQAGVHIYHDRDEALYANRSYLCVNADGAGPRMLRFPNPVDAFDPFTGQTLARHTTSLTRELRDKETWLIRYVP